MPIDSREKRQAVSVLSLVLAPSPTPNATPDAEWRAQVAWGYYLAAALTDYFGRSRDMNTAYRDVLNARYSTTNNDLAPLLARWLQQKTSADSTRAYKQLTDKARGLEGPGV